MPYITTIERLGIEQGLQQGLLQSLQRVLLKRSGELPEVVHKRLLKLSAAQLDLLTDTALSAQSLEEFIAALPQDEETE